MHEFFVCFHTVSHQDECCVVQSVTVEDVHLSLSLLLWPSRKGQVFQRALENGTQKVNGALPLFVGCGERICLKQPNEKSWSSFVRKQNIMSEQSLYKFIFGSCG